MPTGIHNIRHYHRRIPSGFGLSRTLAMITAVLIVGGCVISPHRVVLNETPPAAACYVTKHFPTSLYRLAAGDVLEFLYLTIPTVTNKPYRLSVSDQIDVEFNFHPVMNRTVRVRPDGMISIPRKNDVRAANLTADELKNKLTKIYSDILRKPEITVTVRDFNVRLDEIQRAIETAPHGQARLIKVRPDGHLSLPLIPDMTAAGRTIPEITKQVNNKYASLLGDIEVSVLLREVVGNLIFVDGEVAKPGVFNMRGPTTVQEAIAMAGGTRDTAEPSSVLVITKGPGGKFLTRLTNLTHLNSNMDYMLRRNDMVYVPKSVIARADVWVDQNIRKLLLFDGWGMGLTADLGRTRTR
ncbi:polysaccharide biosynthesis/export family protein [Thermodesulfobacteriota bacterium]